MTQVPLLDELAIVAATAVVVTVVLSRLKLPTVAGLLAAGALLGPHALSLATSVHAIEVLAEVGVVLLLFSIGLEFSLSRLRDILRQVALGGLLQVGATVAVTVAVAQLVGVSVRTGLFYGFVFALSSTAIVLRALAERRELDAPHGRFIVGALIFQDLCVVPMVLIAKGVLATLAAMAMRFPARVAWLAGVGLAQFGEFGFVLTRLAQSSGVIDDAAVAPLLAAGVLSMFLTPLLVRAAPHISAGERLLAPLERLLGVRSIDEADHGAKLEDHVVVVGFGIAGRLAAQALERSGLRCVILEINADNVRAGRAMGLPIFYGDATSEEALQHAHIDKARLAVLLMNDPAAARRVVDTLRRIAPTVPVLMRAHYHREREPLLALGAREVVSEEMEGALAILTRLLSSVDVPRDKIEQCVAQARVETQASERARTVAT